MTAPPNSTEPQTDPRDLARAEFVSLLTTHGDDVPLTEAAAWMCAEERGLDTIAPLMAEIAALSEGLFVPEGTPVFEAVARLNHHLFNTLGFVGDKEDYGSPENSLLDSVVRDRKGIPITLSLITMAVADSVGLKMQGIGFPTHFLVAPTDALPRFFVDPFYGGRVLTSDHLEPWFVRISSQTGGRMPPLTWWLKPVNTRQILVRMNNNLQAAYLGQQDLKGALRCVERLLVLTPEAIEARRDRGLLRIELGQEEEGAKDLDVYLAARQFENALSD